MFEQIINWLKAYIQYIKEQVIKAVVWGEQELKGKTGAEKKAIVVQRLDDMIRLPVWLEFADDMALPWLVDKACDLLNDMYGHVWPEAAGHDTEEKAAAMPDPDVMAAGVPLPDENPEAKEGDGDANVGAETD